MGSKNKAGCNCCNCSDSCLFFTDSFDGASFDAGWTGTANWTLNSGQVESSNSNATLLYEPSKGMCGTGMSVETNATVSSLAGNSQHIRVIACYFDGSSYLYMDVSHNGTNYVVKIGEHTSADSDLDSMTFSGLGNTLKLCFDSLRYRLTGTVSGNATDDSYVQLRGVPTIDVKGKSAGIGLGSASGVNVVFTDFTQYKISADCETCLEECSPDACTDESPDQLQVVISGMANDDCTDCASLDGTYVLDRITSYNNTPTCAYRVLTGVVTCSGEVGETREWVITALIGVDDGGDAYLAVELGYTAPTGGNIFGWATTSATPFDCLNFSSESLTVVAAGPGGSACDHTGATCTVTSL